jgi:hypothetical protein
MNRRDALKTIGLGAAAVGAVSAPFALAANRDADLVVADYEHIKPMLTPRARAAAENQVKSTLWVPPGTGDCYPCQYLSVMLTAPAASAKEPADVKSIHLSKAFVPRYFLQEYARMLNDFAEQGWEASLTPLGSLAFNAPVTTVATTPQTFAVYSFLFFRDKTLITPDDFNARFPGAIANTEGCMGDPIHPVDFRWVG